ncbi:hypothetical protein [Flammeovirga sp. EKP202]|uniref:hypothetical protein n=1 Tax=Flammeovirga sp. EKP202 TaxID=2770592 RepID=UPI00165F5068|nr:hypothetical protein [Flammeovirga sp. EKP202]MBD0401049.1 hypothetical protein [Flammeovirga sp. EKP202]
MQTQQKIIEKENRLLNLFQKLNNNILVNRALLALMIIAPLYDIFNHYSTENYALTGVYVLMILVLLMGAYFFDHYLTKTVIGIVEAIIILEVVAIIMTQAPPTLISIQFKFFMGLGFLKAYFNAKNISILKRDLQFRKAEIELLREEISHQHKTRLRGLSVYVNPQYG